MTLVLISPGTGSFHCGSCIRDNSLARALRQLGQDVLVVPLYLPLVTDTESAAEGTPIFFGGVNVYLQQQSKLFRHTPAWLDRFFDAPSLLRAAGRRAGMTEAADLGALTVSMLRGENGRQHKELEKLIAFLSSQSTRPTVVCLSNGLLVGMVQRIREALRVPVVVSLQGEDAFLDSLPEPYRSEAWAELRRRAGAVDAFVGASHYYGQTMEQRLGLAKGQLHVIANGIETEGYAPGDTDPDPPVVGYLARMCEDKGLPALVQAFIELRRRPGIANTRLHIAGTLTAADEGLVARLRASLKTAGVLEHVAFSPNLDLARKQEFLRSISVLCVPAMYGEAFGLYLLEAWASGVPVVQPRVASFPELLADTGAGLLTESDEPAELANALSSLLGDPTRRRRLGALGRQAVLDRFTSGHMAKHMIALIDQLVLRRA